DTIMAEVFSEDLVASSETLVEDFKNLYEFKERLLITADELLIQSLIDIVQSLIIQNYYMFLQRSSIRMLHFIAHYKQFNELNEAYLETICKNPSLLFDSDEFVSLEENALKLILECDNLDMKESIIWKKLVQWGKAQHEQKLHELTKLIRFYQIDPKKFVPEVWEYMDILLKDLIKDVVHCHLDSDAKPSYKTFLIRWGNFRINSELINKEIVLLLIKWIDGKTTDDNTSKGFHYKFNLLFRSNLDGHASQAFHRRCDNKGQQLLLEELQTQVVLLEVTIYLIGMEIIFIFLLDTNNLKKAMLSRVNHNLSDCAIGCDGAHGPSFGEGPDLHISNNKTI
ncbi:5417_t:CDS:2, partial [Racocetra fulgida]